MADFDDVRRLGMRLPEVVEAPSYRGSPALKVRTRPFCRLWAPSEHARDDVHDSQVLVVFCDPDEKEALLDAHQGVLFSTPHYAGYPALLVRLDDVDPELLAELLEDSYRTRAPRALIRSLDAAANAE